MKSNQGKIAELKAEIAKLRLELESTKRDKADLEILLENTAAHSSAIEDDLEMRVHKRTLELLEKNQELEIAYQNLKETQAQLIHTEKMSSLGQMVAGIAHEINNPVNFIHANISHLNHHGMTLLNLLRLYQNHCPDVADEILEFAEEGDIDFVLEDMPKILDSMKIGTDRIKQIVLSLRIFSRLDEAGVKYANIEQGIDSTLIILNHRLVETGIEVVRNYGNIPLCLCYPAQLNQVFMNILSNAIDALNNSPERSGKKITITTSVSETNLFIKIKDNGLGIPAEIQSKIFEPFFTTKEVGDGTGLGLSISYQIVEKHKGKIEVVSAIEEETEFSVTLPRLEKGASVGDSVP